MLSPEKAYESLREARILMPKLFPDNQDIPFGASDAEDLTFIGFTVPSKGKGAIKYYFRPSNTALVNLLSSQERNENIEKILKAAEGFGIKPFEFSVNTTNGAPEAWRLLWTIPSSIRADNARMEVLIRSLLDLMHMPNLSSTVLRTANCLQDSLKSRLNPLYLFGGHLNKHGVIEKGKLDFDTDIGESDVLYNNSNSIKSFSALLQLFPSFDFSSAMDDRQYIAKFVNRGFDICLLGMNMDADGLTNLKIYLRKNEFPSESECNLLEEVMEEYGCKLPYPLYTVSDYFKNKGWGYSCFYIGISREAIKTIKHYFCRNENGTCVSR